jgi:hypothetical protein
MDTLGILALLEGSRRQESGDTAGAWDCYRAVLRMAAHIQGRGSVDQRRASNFGLLGGGWLQRRLATWAADPRTTIPQLRGVLDDVLKTEPKSDGDSFAVKTGYLDIMRWMERPVNPRDLPEIEGGWTIRLGDMQLSADKVASSCASPNAVAASCDCSVPIGWRTWNSPSRVHGNRPFGPSLPH